MTKAIWLALLVLAGGAGAQSLPAPRWVESPLVGKWEPTSASTKEGPFGVVLAPEALLFFRPDGIYVEKYETTLAAPGFVPSAGSEDMQRMGSWRAARHRVVIDATSKFAGRVVLTCDWTLSGDELTLVAVSWKVYGKDRVAVVEDFRKYPLTDRTVRYRRVAKLAR
jgi:hypothetical protein